MTAASTAMAAVTLAATAFASAAPAAVIDFDTAADFTLFTPNAAENNLVTYNSTAGVGGGGGLSVTGDGRVYSYNAESFDLSSGGVLTVSLDAKDGTNTTNTGIANRVALVGSAGDGLSPPNFPASFYADFNDSSLRIILNTGNGTAPTPVPVTFPNGNWNRLVMTVQDLGSTLAVEAKLYDLGATGISTPNLLGTISATYTGTLATDTSVYAAFKVGNSGTLRSTAADNFVAAIPEPASLAILGLSGALIRRRRRA